MYVCMCVCVYVYMCIHVYVYVIMCMFGCVVCKLLYHLGRPLCSWEQAPNGADTT